MPAIKRYAVIISTATIAATVMTSCGEREEMPTVDPWKEQAKSQKQIAAKSNEVILTPTPIPETRENLMKRGLLRKGISTKAFGRPILFGDSEIRLLRSEEESPLAILDFSLVSMRIVETSWTQIKFTDIRDGGRVCVAPLPAPVKVPLTLAMSIKATTDTPYSMSFLNITEQIAGGAEIDKVNALMKKMETDAAKNLPAYMDSAKKVADLVDKMDRAESTNDNTSQTSATAATAILKRIAYDIAEAQIGQDKSSDFKHLQKCMALYETGNTTEILRINGFAQ